MSSTKRRCCSACSAWTPLTALRGYARAVFAGRLSPALPPLLFFSTSGSGEMAEACWGWLLGCGEQSDDGVAVWEEMVLPHVAGAALPPLLAADSGVEGDSCVSESTSAICRSRLCMTWSVYSFKVRNLLQPINRSRHPYLSQACFARECAQRRLLVTAQAYRAQAHVQ